MSDEPGPSKKRRTEENEDSTPTPPRRSLAEILGRPFVGRSRFRPAPENDQGQEGEAEKTGTEQEDQVEDDGLDDETRKKLKREYNAIVAVSSNNNNINGL